MRSFLVSLVTTMNCNKRKYVFVWVVKPYEKIVSSQQIVYWQSFRKLFGAIELQTHRCRWSYITEPNSLWTWNKEFRKPVPTQRKSSTSTNKRTNKISLENREDNKEQYIDIVKTLRNQDLARQQYVLQYNAFIWVGWLPVNERWKCQVFNELTNWSGHEETKTLHLQSD